MVEYVVGFASDLDHPGENPEKRRDIASLSHQGGKFFVVEHGGPGPFGAKGLGESGMLGVAAAIANAIEDAVGVRVSAIPFTPERVLAAIEAGR